MAGGGQETESACRSSREAGARWGSRIASNSSRLAISGLATGGTVPQGSARTTPAKLLGVTEAIRDADEDSFAQLIEPYRRELHAHCYRMLGSVHDADDALQETLLGAWKGRSGFEGRSSLRSWLYAIATNACLRILEGRKRRELPGGAGRGDDPREPLAQPLAESVWIEPYPDELLRYENRESVELAYIAALQLLPPNQRAALILREVLGFSARETAEILDTSAGAVNSALQRARAKLERELPARSQQETLQALGDERSRQLVAGFLDAWNRADVAAIVAMMSEEASFSMPPLPTWYRGKDDIAAFINEWVFRSTWRFEPTSAGGQPAMAGYRRDRESGRDRLDVLVVLTFQGELVAAVTAFIGTGVLARIAPPGTPHRTDEFRP
jgi:RNA polymerase sigma-70 factor, ECF subfamily